MSNHPPMSGDALSLRFIFFKDEIWGNRGCGGGLMLGFSYKGIEIESEFMQTRWNYTSQPVYS